MRVCLGFSVFVLWFVPRAIGLVIINVGLSFESCKDIHVYAMQRTVAVLACNIWGEARPPLRAR